MRHLTCFLVVKSVVQHKHKVDDVDLTVKRYNSDEDIRAEVIMSDIPPRTSHFIAIYLCLFTSQMVSKL